MTCYVTDKQTNKVKEVKNLGWLLRNWKDVHYFNVTTCSNGMATLEAVSDNWGYVTDFADSEVLHRWLNRPVFKGLTCYWIGFNGDKQKYRIGN